MIPDGRKDQAGLISFRQLQLFDSIARTNSVRRASEECSLSQPAVTQALATLEQRIGAPLVDRRANGSFLNDAGQIFHRRALRFFDQMRQAVAAVCISGDAAEAEAIAKRLSRSQVRSLIAVIDHNSFALATDELQISLASLQRSIRDLEANLEVALCHRSASGLMLAPPGYEFGRRMKLALQEIEWGILEIGAANGSFATDVVIGAMPFGGSVLLASALDDFVRAYPHLQLHILNDTAPVMLKSLRNGRVDLVVGLLPETEAEDLSCEAFAPTPYFIVAQPSHPLLRQDRVTIEDMLAYDWVISSPGSSRRACFDRLFVGHDGPRARIVTGVLPILRNLLVHNDRLTLMTSYELRHEDLGLAEIPFAPIEPAPVMGVTMRKGWLPTAMHSNFIEILRRRMVLPPEGHDPRVGAIG